MKGRYLTAEVCLNGHLITDAIESHPEARQPFCMSCGSKTTTTCEACGEAIRGHYSAPHVLISHTKVPRFCHQCGVAYPWTDARLRAADELADELENLSPEERGLLKRSIGELVQDTPATEVAGLRVKKILTKAGAAGAEALRSILVDIAGDAAKKALGL